MLYTGPKDKDTMDILHVAAMKRILESWKPSVVGDDGLVWHWKWQTTITIHALALELAKGVDPILHMCKSYTQRWFNGQLLTNYSEAIAMSNCRNEEDKTHNKDAWQLSASK